MKPGPWFAPIARFQKAYSRGNHPEGAINGVRRWNPPPPASSVRGGCDSPWGVGERAGQEDHEQP